MQGNTKGNAACLRVLICSASCIRMRTAWTYANRITMMAVVSGSVQVDAPRLDSNKNIHHRDKRWGSS